MFLDDLDEEDYEIAIKVSATSSALPFFDVHANVGTTHH